MDTATTWVCVCACVCTTPGPVQLPLAQRPAPAQPEWRRIQQHLPLQLGRLLRYRPDGRRNGTVGRLHFDPQRRKHYGELCLSALAHIFAIQPGGLSHRISVILYPDTTCITVFVDQWRHCRHLHDWPFARGRDGSWNDGWVIEAASVERSDLFPLSWQQWWGSAKAKYRNIMYVRLLTPLPLFFSL